MERWTRDDTNKSLDAAVATPRAQSLTEGQWEKSALLSLAGENAIGVWSCSPGRFPSSREGRDELAFILSGRAVILSDAGDSMEVGQGDALLLPDGWSGFWDISETVTKLYVNLPRM
jgi:uncharacterized cupin superfamily protein